MKNYYLSNSKNLIHSNNRILTCFLKLIQGGVAYRDPKRPQDYGVTIGPGEFKVGYIRLRHDTSTPVNQMRREVFTIW